MIRCNINFKNPFATIIATIIVALHEMLRIVRYDQRSELSSVFLQRFYHQFFFLFNKHLFFSKQSRISRAHFSCGEIGRSGRIKDKTRSQGLTYVLRVFRFSPVTRNLDFRIGYTWREGGLARSSRENPVARKGFTCIRSTSHGVRSLCFASCP